MHISRAGKILCAGGESPYWSVAEQVLLFVDGRGRKVWQYKPATDEESGWDMPAFTAMVNQASNGDPLVGLPDGVHTLDRKTGALTRLTTDEMAEGTHSADAKVDRRGRLIATTSDKKMKDPIGGIFRVDGTRMIQLDTGFSLSNGPCWSPGGETFYCSDSRQKAIFAYDYDNEAGTVANRRVFADTSAIGGIADGSTVDSDGRLWSAFCVAGKIACFNRDGSVQRIIDGPTAGVSSVIFGGPKLDQLYVTSIDVSLFGHPKSPHAGELFVIEDLGVTGLPEIPMQL